MLEIIIAQGGKKNINPDKLKLGKIVHIYKAKKSGKIIEVNDDTIATVAKLAGAPRDKGAGIYLNVHLGNKVKVKDKLFTIYAESDRKLNDAMKMASEKFPIKIQ